MVTRCCDKGGLGDMFVDAMMDLGSSISLIIKSFVKNSYSQPPPGLKLTRILKN